MKMKKLLWLTLLFCIHLHGFASIAVKPLNKAELTDLIVGKTLYPNYAHFFLNEGISFQNKQAEMYIHKDGSIYLTFDPRLDTGGPTSIEKTTGNWTIDNNGKFCQIWNPTFLSQTVEHCGYWYPMENVYLVITDNDKVLLLVSKRYIKNTFHLF